MHHAKYRELNYHLLHNADIRLKVSWHMSYIVLQGLLYPFFTSVNLYHAILSKGISLFCLKESISPKDCTNFC